MKIIRINHLNYIKSFKTVALQSFASSSKKYFQSQKIFFPGNKNNRKLLKHHDNGSFKTT